MANPKIKDANTIGAKKKKKKTLNIMDAKYKGFTVVNTLQKKHFGISQKTYTTQWEIHLCL